ncbi:MAG: hypothetical protein EA397_01895 [Deltaproteobacteria bacterium]|nr:MAG: hypothetical protein EA397_01895 [Deltaproteobacteria bacterium]
MGIFSWLAPSPERRLTRAKRALEAGDWAMARDEAVGLDLDEARQVYAEACDQLVTVNLEAALSWANAGDEERVRVHMELAAEHHAGGREPDFRAARKQIRELRLESEAREAESRKRKEARTLSVDPLHLGGGVQLPSPGTELDGPDAEELRARLALVVENYPVSLRETVADLGELFANAVMDLEDGRPDLALQGLLLLPDDAALVRWERARCAYSLGDPRSAARELRAFAKLASGHHPVGRTHSGILLAQSLAESDDIPGALRVLRELRSKDPKLGGFLFAQLLAATDQLPEADGVLRQLIKQHPLESSFYKLLAFVRVRGGQRTEAMTALEKGLHQNACASGTCSARPMDPEMKRMLATLYLEDGIETKRALALLSEAQPQGTPTWDDVYAQALAARAQGDTRALGELLRTLHDNTPSSDPRAERISTYLPAPA